MTRRSHAKTRTGCATCKLRRIKCKEEKPACANCIKHGTICPGYTEVKRTVRHAQKKPDPGERGAESNDDSHIKLQPDLIDSRALDSLHLSRRTTLEIEPDPNFDDIVIGTSTPKQSTNSSHSIWDAYEHMLSSKSGSITKSHVTLGSALRFLNEPGKEKDAVRDVDEEQISDLELNLLRGFAEAVADIPSLTFTAEASFWCQIHRYSTKWASVMESILSFSATYMHFITHDDLYARIAIVHRGRALANLQSDMKLGQEGVDAAIASSILLADQAGFEGDWQSYILHQKGLSNLCLHHLQNSEGSIFARSRLLDIESRMMRKRRVNVKCIQSSAQGSNCYASIQKLEDFFSKSTRNPDTGRVDFLGTEKAKHDVGVRQIEYVAGGLGHLVALACDIQEIWAVINQQSAQPSQFPASTANLILQGQGESDLWVGCLPQSIISDALANDPPSLLLLVYKYGLDLLLHKCLVTQKDGQALMPTPAVVLAISYIRNTYAILSTNRTDEYSEEEQHMFIECLEWPLWVLNWATAFVSEETVLAAMSRLKAHRISVSISSG